MEHSCSKIIIIGGILITSISNGFLTGQIASMVLSLNKNEENINLKRHETSFITSSFFLLCVLGMGLAAVVSDKLGRRWSFILFSTIMTLNWIILYNAYNMLTFMASRVLAGVALGSLFALKLCTTSEYTSPNKRGLFLNMISTLAPAVGAGIAHVLGVLIQWRNVVLVAIIPSMISMIVPYFWIESPHWLASQGRFEECEIAFRQIHGNDSEAELQLLVTVEKAKLVKARETQTLQTMKKLKLAFRSRYFWDLMLLSVFIHSFIIAGGKLAFSTLSIEIIAQLTGSNDVLFFTLLINGLLISGSATSCILITRLSMRNLLFTTSFIAIFVLVFLSGCIYFNNGTVLFEWLNVILLAVYFFIVKSGPYPVLEALLGEIYPLEVKVYCFFISCSILMTGHFLNLMTLTYMVSAMGYYGVFLLNAAIMSISLGYIWIRLPETKGRTLQEVELYFKTKTFENLDQVLSNEQINALI